MKFGEQLLSSQIPEWRFNYLKYNALKTYLNDIVLEMNELNLNNTSNQISHENLKSFVKFLDLLNKNITLIYEFYSNLKSSITSEIEFFKLKEKNSFFMEKDMNSLQNFILNCFITSIKLKEFVFLNKIGVQKILKKHDKATGGNPNLSTYETNLVTNYLLELTEDDLIEIQSELKELFQKSGGFMDSLQFKTEVRKLPFNIVEKKNFIIDMDGVIYHGSHLLPGVVNFINWLKSTNKNFLFLTNSSDKTQEMLQEKLKNLGIEVSKSHFYTSALSTARFLAKQHNNEKGRCFVIGEVGLKNAISEAGFIIAEEEPVDYVVVGETSSDSTFNFTQISKAINFLNPSQTKVNGNYHDSAELQKNQILNRRSKSRPKFIATNCDVVDRALPSGWSPSCGSFAAPIEAACGLKPYYLGKPNPLMMASATELLGGKREETVIIGDRMDTDIIGGLEAGITTLLVLTGVTTLDDLDKFPYQPDYILGGIDELMQVIFANTQQLGFFSPLNSVQTTPLSVRKIAKKRSMEIDKNLELESKIIKLPSTKVLILGSSDAGKSTLIRGMRIKYVKNFTLEEKEYFKLIIHKNIIDTLKKLIKYYIKNCNLKNNGTDQKVQLQLSTNASVNMEDFYLYLNLFKSHDFKCRLSSEIKNAVQVTWNNEIIKKIFFNKTQCGINIQDTTIYYFNDLQRLLDEQFSPTELDVLYLKNATKTVTETVIHTRTMNIKLFDVGGQKRLRNSWTPFFDDVSMILFVVALSSYNQMMKEDPTVNRLNDSFTLFESLANNKLLRGCKFILLLNKIDLLAEKLKLIPLKTYFNDYEGGADTKLAKNYFRKKFLEKSKGREIKHILFITATELSAMKRITGNLVKVIGNVAMKASPVTV
ncbi:hypothetical protein HK099_004624 [Clydaea vesicula]|uniref:SPX domain-containing protein n=1 Tax=Clydaea vesicula TaxID=447962 RepID=A0AAD5U2U2_9FUNG|nr:hypothetical protein HK099_004624 [Clydaea vesicula]